MYLHTIHLSMYNIRKKKKKKEKILACMIKLARIGGDPNSFHKKL